MSLWSSLRRAAEDIKNNLYLYAVCTAVISMCVFILSAFALFYINATELLDAWKSGIRVTAYLGEGISKSGIESVRKEISALEGVASVEFISKKRAFESLREDMGGRSDLLSVLDKNPLPDAFEVRISDSFVDSDEIESIAVRIESIENVDDVEYARKWLDRFGGVYSLFRLTGLVLAAMFVLALTFIVANTLRLILYSRRDEIEIMWIVGADEAFIKQPFYLEGIFLGFTGAVIGLGFLYLAFLATVPRFEPEVLFSFYEIRFLPPFMTLSILLCSTGVGWAGCRFSVKRFLKSRP